MPLASVSPTLAQHQPRYRTHLRVSKRLAHGADPSRVYRNIVIGIEQQIRSRRTRSACPRPVQTLPQLHNILDWILSSDARSRVIRGRIVDDNDLRGARLGK